MLEFKHTFEEDPKHGDLTVEKDANPSEQIKLNVEDGKTVWLAANKAGWLHLARICAELGTRDLEPGYHFHMDFSFKTSDGDGKGEEVAFEVV